MRGCCTITTRMRLASAASTAADLPPQPIASSGQGGGQRGRLDRRQRTRPPGRRQAPPQAARAQHPRFGREPGRFGEPERLGAQTGIVLGQDPGGGGEHGAVLAGLGGLVNG